MIPVILANLELLQLWNFHLQKKGEHRDNQKDIHGFEVIKSAMSKGITLLVGTGFRRERQEEGEDEKDRKRSSHWLCFWN